MDYNEIYRRNVPGSAEILGKYCIGIAGCGGLGSNVAVMLARAGIGKLILADYDRVEISNLNRQHFFLQDIGKIKVEALAGHIKNINPEINLELKYKKLCPDDISETFNSADIMIEAFDRAESKKWLIEKWLKAFPSIPIICASGISGIGKTEDIRISRAGNIYMVGDQATDMNIGLCSARVTVVAAMQANLAVEILINRVSA